MTKSEGATVLQDRQMMSSLSWLVGINVTLERYRNGYYCTTFSILHGPLGPDPASLANPRLTDTTVQDRVTILLVSTSHAGMAQRLLILQRETTS